MTTSNELNEAMIAQQLRYDKAKDGAERAQVAHENRIETDKLMSGWKAWLASEYASDFSPAVQALIFEQAETYGYDFSYEETANNYAQVASFIRKVQTA
jgi:hypothetical protein